jgi:serine/threonine-protein kinase
VSSCDDFPPGPGTRLDDRFVVQEVLGSGGMGVVVAAKHLGLRRLVAIKLLRPEFAHLPDVVSRFLREARAAARLKSEHVATVLDVGTLEQGLPYFVMDYLVGTDLGTLLESQGPFEVDLVVEYALQTLETLAEAHRAGIVHRDLKPSNLFLTTREDDSPLIKVLDFGISKLIGWEVTGAGIITRQGKTLGSPLYMSPEQVRDSSRVDARADIWALGAVMHELLSGRPPFDYSDVRRVIRAICSERYRLPERSDVPEELFEILFQCLRKDRMERFQDAEELARAFQPLVRTPSAQVSIERILRTRRSLPVGRLTPVPEPTLIATDPDSQLPSVTPVERDTPPSEPKRAPFWVGVRAGAVVGVVWAAFVLGRYLAHDERPSGSGAATLVATTPAAPLPRAEPAPKTSASAPREALPLASASGAQPSNAPSQVSASRAPAKAPRARAARDGGKGAATPAGVATQASPKHEASSAPPTAGESPLVGVRPGVRKVRTLDPENPFVPVP